MAARLAVVVLLAETFIQGGVGSSLWVRAVFIFFAPQPSGGSAGPYDKDSPDDHSTPPQF